MSWFKPEPEPQPEPEPDPRELEALRYLAQPDPKDPEGPRVFDKLRCAHCGGAHLRACPRVKRMRWTDNGRLAEVEFWPSGEWPETGIVWPEALTDVEPEQEKDS